MGICYNTGNNPTTFICIKKLNIISGLHQIILLNGMYDDEVLKTLDLESLLDVTLEKEKV